MAKVIKYELYWEDVNEQLIFAELDDLAWKLAEQTFHYKKINSVYTFRHNRLAAFYSTADSIKESKAGYVFYTKLANVLKIIRLKKIASKETQARLRELGKIRLRFLPDSELKKMLLAGLDLYHRALSIHYLTQPQFFEQFPVWEKQTPVQKKNLAILARARLRYTRPAWTNAMNFTKVLFREFEKRYNLKSGLAEYLSNNELVKDKIFLKSLQERAKRFVLVSTNHRIKIYSGLRADKYINQLEQYSNTKMVEGVCGNRGVVKGTVFVVKNENLNLGSLPKGMRKGMVLILQNAWPEFNIYYSKASAIVTNEGGITSHGVVVAREFGIPCVVGTKIATKVFKTGDRVEVNATKGIVKILDK